MHPRHAVSRTHHGGGDDVMCVRYHMINRECQRNVCVLIIGLFCKRALQKRRYSAKERLYSAHIHSCDIDDCMCVRGMYVLDHIKGLFCKRAL